MAARYTPEQMGAIRRKIRESAEEAFARHGIEDLDGKRLQAMVRYGLEDLDEWAVVLGFR